MRNEDETFVRDFKSQEITSGNWLPNSEEDLERTGVVGKFLLPESDGNTAEYYEVEGDGRVVHKKVEYKEVVEEGKVLREAGEPEILGIGRNGAVTKKEVRGEMKTVLSYEKQGDLRLTSEVSPTD